MSDPAAYNPYVLGDPTAVMGRRAIAKIIDLILGAVGGMTSLWAIVHSFRTTTVSDPADYCARIISSSHACVRIGTDQVWQYDQPSRWYYLIGFAIWLVIIWLEGRYGWTPGKLVMSLRTVRQDTGLTCGFGKSLIRNVVWFVDGFCFALVGLLVANRSPGHRRLGDQAASTLVVDKTSMGQPPMVPGLTVGAFPQPGWGGPPPVHAPGLTPMPYPPTPQVRADVPIWDDARDAYIQFDTERGAWLEYDQSAGEWKPISV